jgi:transcriptional regulator GlxA family with amidase domain
VLVVPGAIAIDDVVSNTHLLHALGDLVADVPLVASVCTGAFILGELGMLDDRPWTTHWEDVDLLAPKVQGEGRSGVRWVDSGGVVTSGGLSSGIAMALHLVDRLAGRDLAVRTARQIEYDWDPELGVTT